MSAVLEMNKPSRALRPDAQAFDEIRIFTEPRYKQSELSGDEWRISAHVEFYRNGMLQYESQFRNIETACGFLFSEHGKACEAQGYFAGEGNICDQEGCSDEATVRLDRKITHCDRCGVAARLPSKSYRLFCDEHKTRGDCGIDDADRNYEVSVIPEQTKCEHGKGLTDYCEPCGRVNGGGP